MCIKNMLQLVNVNRMIDTLIDEEDWRVKRRPEHE